jgi:hypothetical protein
VFVTDIGSHTVNMASLAGGYANFTPLGTAGFFSNPYGIAVDANDDLFVSDIGYSAVREISLIDGWTTISTPGNGFYVPIGTAVDSQGNIFVADTDNSEVKKVSQTIGDFGPVPVSTTSAYPISMTFFFDAPTNLGSTAIFQNSSLSDFSDAGTGTCQPNTPYAGVSTCTVDVLFTPQQAGLRSAVVELLDGSGFVIAAGPIEGTGVSE